MAFNNKQPFHLSEVQWYDMSSMYNNFQPPLHSWIKHKFDANLDEKKDSFV